MTKKLLFLSLAALVVLAGSCKKQPADSDKYASVLKQWRITFEGEDSYSSIYDYAAEPGCCLRMSDFWKDLPDATYLVDNAWVYPCTSYSVNDGVYHLEITVSGDGTPDVRYYEEFSDVTETTASWKSVYHDSTRDIVEYGKAEVMKKPVKVMRNPLGYVAFVRLGFVWSYVRTPVSGVKQFEALSKQKSKWTVLSLDGEGAESDYEGIEASGKIISVHHTFPGVGKAETGLTVAKKREIAAKKGAAALILLYTYDYSSPMTLDQYNTLPNDDKSIPVAIWGGDKLVNDNYEIIIE